MTPTLEAFYVYWAEWFAQPLTEKMKLSKEVTGKSGYMPFASEFPGFTGQKDPKEYFHVKTDHLQLTTTALPGRQAYATNDVFWECFNAATVWCKEHGLEELPFRVNAADCVLRIIHYPAHPTGCVGEAHRDFDLLTVSVEGTAPGLEIQDEDSCNFAHGGWIPQETGIQVGEMLEIYDAATYDDLRRDPLKATTHRVSTPPNTERFKAVFFYLPPMDFELRPGLTAQDYLTGPNGVLTRAGTYQESRR